MPFSSPSASEATPDVPSDAGDPRVALSVLATIDPVLRDSTVFGLVVGAPRVVALRHDIRAAEDALRRVVVDATGVIEDEVVPLEHACLSCAVREDAVPTLRRLADDGRWDHVVLALPVAAESLPVVRALAAQTTPAASSSASVSLPSSPSPTSTRSSTTCSTTTSSPSAASG